MTTSGNFPPVEELKAQANRLRQELRRDGTELSHSAALELVAHQHGARNWNTLRSQAGNRMRLNVGDRVAGRYLGQSFAGTVRALSVIGDSDHRRVTVQFDEPVDVVRFESFSAMRQRVSGEIGWDGRSTRCTSDGAPQLVIWPDTAT
ncbi:glyoxalase superfamily protein [Primorskyibacter sp. S87]|uniref:glyoxalase superfamily protein n=1 Tax=Primorskyibacter sp. S87 TaxID=3415126 RepID=UPI003C7C94A2